MAEFDSRYRDGVPFCLTNHPQVTGRPSRITVLEKLIEYVKSKSNVQFMKIGDYAKIHQL